MSRPTLSEHDTRIALLERGATHDAEHDKALLDKLDGITDEITSLRKYVEAEVRVITDRQTETETRLDRVLGNVRAFGAGMAAAFTLIGTALGAGLTSLVEWLK